MNLCASPLRRSIRILGISYTPLDNDEINEASSKEDAANLLKSSKLLLALGQNEEAFEACERAANLCRRSLGIPTPPTKVSLTGSTENICTCAIQTDVGQSIPVPGDGFLDISLRRGESCEVQHKEELSPPLNGIRRTPPPYSFSRMIRRSTISQLNVWAQRIKVAIYWGSAQKGPLKQYALETQGKMTLYAYTGTSANIKSLAPNYYEGSGCLGTTVQGFTPSFLTMSEASSSDNNNALSALEYFESPLGKFMARWAKFFFYT